MNSIGRVLLAVCASAALVSPCAAVSPTQKCESAKVKSAGQYVACLTRETARAIQMGTPTDYSDCEWKLGTKWVKAEAAGGAACPTRFDFPLMEEFLAAHAAAVAAALAGGGLPPDHTACAADLQICTAELVACRCGNGTIDLGEQCDGAALGTCTNGCNAACGCLEPAGCEATTGGFCWFRGMLGESCTEVCANANRPYDPATSSYAGYEGSMTNCQAVLADLGLPVTPLFDINPCGDGIGCGVLPNIFSLRCTWPATTEAAFLETVERVCACQ
jgi:hypothetical protein